MNDKVSKVLSLFQRKSISHKVEGKTLNFYPVSVAQLYRMQTIFNPLIDAVRIWTLKANDVSRVEQQEHTLDEKGMPVQITTIKQSGEIDTKLALHRSQETKEALTNIVAELFSEENKAVLGGLLADSLRDNFPRPVDDETVIEFVNELDINAMTSLIQGFVRANAKVLGPFVKRLQGKWEGLVDQALSETSEKLSQQTQPEPAKSDNGENLEELTLDPTM